jgi:hypothetical protein
LAVLVNVPIWHSEYVRTFLLLTADRHHADCRMNNKKVEFGTWCYEIELTIMIISPPLLQDKSEESSANILSNWTFNMPTIPSSNFIHPIFLLGLYHAYHRINGFIWLIC